MLAFVEEIVREETITIDGYTSNKTMKGIIKDVARALEKYDMGEAEEMHTMSKEFDIEFNNPFFGSIS